MGLNNIELITDRPLEVNLREIAEVKKRYPKHAVIVSLMVESKREAWHEIVKRAEDAGADGLELNFGCPHGMSERGMGSRRRPGARVRLHDHRVGEGGRAHAGASSSSRPTSPTSRDPARAAKKRRRRRASRSSTRSTRIIGVDLDTLRAAARRRRALGARRLLRPGGEADRAATWSQQLAQRSATSACRSRGIGGISDWRDAAEFMLLGCDDACRSARRSCTTASASSRT